MCFSGCGAATELLFFLQSDYCRLQVKVNRSQLCYERDEKQLMLCTCRCTYGIFECCTPYAFQEAGTVVYGKHSSQMVR